MTDLYIIDAPVRAYRAVVRIAICECDGSIPAITCEIRKVIVIDLLIASIETDTTCAFLTVTQEEIVMHHGTISVSQ